MLKFIIAGRALFLVERYGVQVRRDCTNRQSDTGQVRFVGSAGQSGNARVPRLHSPAPNPAHPATLVFPVNRNQVNLPYIYSLSFVVGLCNSRTKRFIL